MNENTEIEVVIDFDRLPETIVRKNAKGYRDYELEHLSEIEKWMRDIFPSYDPDDSRKIKLVITGQMPNWLAIWVGMKISSAADEVKYKPMVSPSFYLKRSVK